MKNRVFLGGTCGNSKWRDELIPLLELNDIDYFNPVVDNWTDDDRINEIDEKENKCNIHLYVITHDMVGIYSIAEAVESIFNKDKKTIFVAMPDGFNKPLLKSLDATCKLIDKYRGFSSITESFDTIILMIKNLIDEKI